MKKFGHSAAISLLIPLVAPLASWCQTLTMPMNLGLAQAEEPGETSYWHWLSVRNYQDQSGNWHVDQLPSSVQRRIDIFVAATNCDVDNECVQVRQPIVDPVPGRSAGPWTYEDLIDASQTVISGEVAGTDFGFIDERPAEMLGIEVEQILKTSSASQPSVIYVAYPQATFQVGRYEFCPYPDDQLPAAPVVGAKVLLVSLEGPMEETDDLFQLLQTGADLYWQAPGASSILATGKVTLQSGELSGFTSIEQLITETEALAGGGQ